MPRRFFLIPLLILLRHAQRATSLLLRYYTLLMLRHALFRLRADVVAAMSTYATL